MDNPPYQSEIVGVAAEHTPPFRVAIDGSTLGPDCTVKTLLAMFEHKHATACSCSQSQSPLDPFIWIRRTGSTYEPNLTATAVEVDWLQLSMQRANKQINPTSLPGSSFTSKAAVHFVVRFSAAHSTTPAKRQRSPSPVMQTGPSSRLYPVENGVFKTSLAKDSPQVKLHWGSGNFYMDVDNIGTVFSDNMHRLAAENEGGLLDATSRLCITFLSSSIYSTRYVSSLLSFYHDIAFADRYDDVCAPLFTAPSVSLPPSASHSKYACLMIDFSQWKMAPARIPAGFADPTMALAALETLDAVESDLVDVLSHSIENFILRYRPKLGLPKFSSGPTPDVLAAFLDWIAAHTTNTKIFVVVHGLCRILDRPFVASTWAQSEHCGLPARRELIRETLLKPLSTSFMSTAGAIGKLMFAGTYLPDWALDSTIAPDQLVNISPLASLHGLSLLHISAVHGKLGDFVRATCDTVRLDFGHSTSSPVRLYAPESVISVMAQYDRLVAGLVPGNAKQMAHLLDSVYDSYTSTVFSQAARLLFPPIFLHNKTAGQLLATIAQKQANSFELTDLVMDSSSVQLGRLYRGTDEDATTRFGRLCLLHGLMHQSTVVPGNYEVSGPGASGVLAKLHDEYKRYHDRYSQRIKRDKYKPQLKLTEDDLQPLKSLTMSILTAESIASLILKYYRSATTPYDLPSDEHGFQADFVLLFRAALLRQHPLAYDYDVLPEVWIRIRDVTTADGTLEKRCDVFVRIHRRNANDILYIFELKYFNARKTADETNKERPGLNLPADDIARFKAFRRALESMRSLPEGWFNLNKISNLKLRTTASQYQTNATLTVSDIWCCFEKRDDDEPVGVNETGRKNATVVAVEGYKQVEGYRDGAVEGIKDELGAGVGFSDSRITDAGPGLTDVVPFIIVNVAGALVYVRRLPTRLLKRKVAVVDAYPWTLDRTRDQTQTIRRAKNAHRKRTVK